MRTEFIQVDPRRLKLLETNARFMPHEVFQRLVSNIKKHGTLTSTPLVAPVGYYQAGDTPQCYGDGHPIYEVLSGNHRTKASIEAGLQVITVQAILDPLERNERLAFQLSHNALTGEDDPAILKKLYDQLDIEWREFAALDDKQLGLLAQVKPGNLGLADLTYQTISLLFLPDEIGKVKEAFEAGRRFSPGGIFMARWGEYERLLSTLEDIGAAHRVRNIATQLMLLLDLAERHIGEISDGWYDRGHALHDKTAPLSSLFGATAIPTKNAVPVKRALDAARERGLSPAVILEQWATAYLESLKEKKAA